LYIPTSFRSFNPIHHRNASFLDLHIEISSEGRVKTKHYDKRDYFIFPLWTFYLFVATFQQRLHMEYISLSWYDIPEFVGPIMISLIECWASNETTETGKGEVVTTKALTS
jgi:hypothetical protein